MLSKADNQFLTQSDAGTRGAWRKFRAAQTAAVLAAKLP
jgi:hypothetical protein